MEFLSPEAWWVVGSVFVLTAVRSLRDRPTTLLEWFFILGTALIGGIGAFVEGGTIFLVVARVIEGAAVGGLVGAFLAFQINYGDSGDDLELEVKGT